MVPLLIERTHRGRRTGSRGFGRLLSLLFLVFGDLVGIADTSRARGVVPVAPANLNAVTTNVRAQESEVGGGQASTFADDLGDFRDLLSDDCVEAGCIVVPILTANVTSKVDKLGVELLNDATRAESDVSVGLGMVSELTYTV